MIREFKELTRKSKGDTAQLDQKVILVQLIKGDTGATGSKVILVQLDQKVMRAQQDNQKVTKET